MTTISTWTSCTEIATLLLDLLVSGRRWQAQTSPFPVLLVYLAGTLELASRAHVKHCKTQSSSK
jgi:hypothetical protein